MSAPLRVAQYVRMSTEHQQYSTENQSQAILEYARVHGMEIVTTYADHGKSGLNLAGRPGLQRLLQDVQRGEQGFEALLVYDVSRWGRFQDADESAYYEYVLKQAGIKIHYCAEQFQNDGTMPSALIKTLKRTMAGEYSRELSVKVFAGQCRLIELGFRQGGPAGFGLRRHLVDQERNFKQVLEDGERKSLQTDRVVLAAGPAWEVEIVKHMFQSFTEAGDSECEIATRLNQEGVLSDQGRPWTRAAVHQILTNPKYVGSNVYNRRSFKLKRKRVRNPPEMWVMKPDAFEPIVSNEVFQRALAIIEERHRQYSDDDMLARLRDLLSRVGRLSGFIIDEADDMPSSSAYAHRFGSLPRAYALIGWSPGRDYSYLEINRKIRAQHTPLVHEIVEQLRASQADVVQDVRTDLLTINSEYTASLILARCQKTQTGRERWIVRFDAALNPDITIAARLQPGNDGVLDYYLLPKIAGFGTFVRFAEHNPLCLEVFRFENLSYLTAIARRVPVEEAA
ncbi:recombinase family protein [Granulicella cerasi]|uniref:Recombinase family protein n=1 Tax=Granulicella cerasi TaxID=741063 RepID=A0ABW1ZCT7_9BACT|nr:recombinase family protein [Granulicella cerasi]